MSTILYLVAVVSLTASLLALLSNFHFWLMAVIFLVSALVIIQLDKR